MTFFSEWVEIDIIQTMRAMPAKASVFLGDMLSFFFLRFRRLRRADRLVAKIPAMDVDLRKDTLKETRRAALLEWLSRLGLKQ